MKCHRTVSLAVCPAVATRPSGQSALSMLGVNVTHVFVPRLDVEVAIIGICGLKAHENKAQGFSPVERDRYLRVCDLKGREKFSRSDQLRSVASRDLSGRTCCFIFVHRAEALCFVLVGFQPTGNDTSLRALVHPAFPIRNGCQSRPSHSRQKILPTLPNLSHYYPIAAS